jgi:hypothetical protein
MVTQALTYPSHVVAVKKVESDVKFVKAGTDEAKAILEKVKGR